MRSQGYGTKPGIYLIRHKSTGKVYVGRTVNVHGKHDEFLLHCQTGCILYEAGSDANVGKPTDEYEFALCEYVEDESKLPQRQQHYIDEFDSVRKGYNSRNAIKKARRGKDPLDNDHALRLAARRGQYSNVRALLEKGADVHSKDDYALRWAARNGHADIVAELLSAGADPNAYGGEPLEWAATNGHLKAVQLLLRVGADPNNGLALQGAAADGHLQIVTELLGAGADVHTNWDAALSGAAGGYHIDVVRELLAAGADAEVLGNWIPLDHPDLLRQLRDAGAEPDETVLKDAVLTRDQRIIEYLREHTDLTNDYLWKKCENCGFDFVEEFVFPSQLERLESDHSDFCPACLTGAFFSDGSSSMSDNEILSYLRDLADVISQVPRTDFGRGVRDLHGLDSDRKKAAIRLLNLKPTTKRVKQRYGSWLNALVQAGVLEGGVQPTPRGTRCLAQDGHVCLSLAEKTIDDFLYAHGIAHEKEAPYPEGNYRVDFQVGEVFVEYFGLKGDPKYDAKAELKAQICSRHGIRLVEIYPDDLVSLKRLKKKLRLVGLK